ncbi:phosphatase PAP2 family protein [Paenibacillus sp. NPDC056579]|uniref:phosphatase PAP2 family protein n=1 Tax=Paenibacillus sp. NPDC056579 TaxID=3345871 RepID=UPI0036B292C7
MKANSLTSHLLALSSLLSIPLLGLIYIYLNHGNGMVHSLVTDFDHQLPFLKVFVLPYLFWYPFLFIAFVYLAFKNREVFYQTLVQFNIGLLICYGFYAVYQTYVPRPVLVGDDWLLQMVRGVYSSDQPYNCFPSTHVLTTYLMMKAYLRTAGIPRMYTAAVTIVSILIIASTQFVKQHVLLDIAGAILVAEGVIYAVTRIHKGWFSKPIIAKPQQSTWEGSLRR